MQVLLAGLATRGVGQDIIAGQAELSRDEAQNLFRDDLVKRTFNLALGLWMIRCAADMAHTFAFQPSG